MKESSERKRHLSFQSINGVPPQVRLRVLPNINFLLTIQVLTYHGTWIAVRSFPGWEKSRTVTFQRKQKLTCEGLSHVLYLTNFFLQMNHQIFFFISFLLLDLYLTVPSDLSFLTAIDTIGTSSPPEIRTVVDCRRTTFIPNLGHGLVSL